MNHDMGYQPLYPRPVEGTGHEVWPDPRMMLGSAKQQRLCSCSNYAKRNRKMPRSAGSFLFSGAKPTSAAQAASKSIAQAARDTRFLASKSLSTASALALRAVTAVRRRHAKLLAALRFAVGGVIQHLFQIIPARCATTLYKPHRSVNLALHSFPRATAFETCTGPPTRLL